MKTWDKFRTFVERTPHLFKYTNFLRLSRGEPPEDENSSELETAKFEGPPQAAKSLEIDFLSLLPVLTVFLQLRSLTLDLINIIMPENPDTLDFKPFAIPLDDFRLCDGHITWPYKDWEPDIAPFYVPFNGVQRLYTKGMSLNYGPLSRLSPDTFPHFDNLTELVLDDCTHIRMFLRGLCNIATSHLRHLDHMDLGWITPYDHEDLCRFLGHYRESLQILALKFHYGRSDCRRSVIAQYYPTLTDLLVDDLALPEFTRLHTLQLVVDIPPEPVKNVTITWKLVAIVLRKFRKQLSNRALECVIFEYGEVDDVADCDAQTLDLHSSHVALHGVENELLQCPKLVTVIFMPLRTSTVDVFGSLDRAHVSTLFPRLVEKQVLEFEDSDSDTSSDGEDEATTKAEAKTEAEAETGE